MLQSSAEVTQRQLDSSACQSASQLGVRRMRDPNPQQRFMVPPPTDAQSPPSIIRTPVILVDMPQNSEQPVTEARSRNIERSDPDLAQPSQNEQQRVEQPDPARLPHPASGLDIGQHNHSLPLQRPHDQLQNDIEPVIPSPQLTEINGQQNSNSGANLSTPSSQAFTMTTY